MGFGEAVATCFSKYVTFSGRARRPEYWYFYLFLLLGSIVTALVDVILFGLPEATGSGTLADVGPVNSLFSLATLLPTFAAGWRRMHDVGKPGYYNFLPVAAMIPAGLIAFLGMQAAPSMMQVFFIIGGLIFFASVVMVLVWLVSRSQPGPNQYGPEPGAEVDVEGVFD